MQKNKLTGIPLFYYPLQNPRGKKLLLLYDWYSKEDLYGKGYFLPLGFCSGH